MKDMYDRLGLTCGRTEGRFGVEIEVEGENLPAPDKDPEFDKVWKVEHDGSLARGRSAEYVFRGPLSLEDTNAALDLMAETYKRIETKADNGIRAGIHVHYNIQDYTPLELLTFITTYYVLEDYLVHWCGKERTGNHFCLRIIDAEGPLFKVIEACRKKDWRHLNTDEIRYAALNLNAMCKYGSVEFRMMKSTDDFELIKRFVALINQIAKGAKNFASPENVLGTVSELEAPERFIRLVMEDYADDFLKFTDISIWDGVHVVQPLAFMVDWDKFDREKINPFV